MFHAVEMKIMEQLESLPLNDKIDRMERLGAVLHRLKHRTPEDSVLIPLNDFADTDDEHVFKMRLDLLTRMSSMSDGPLEALMFLKEGDKVHVIPRAAHLDVIDGKDIPHPATGEVIKDPATQTYLAYTLRPAFMLDKMKTHHKVGQGVKDEGLLLIAPSADACQRMALLGVPAMTVPFAQASHPDEARAELWKLLESGATVIATPEALPTGTVVPGNGVVTLLPSFWDDERRAFALKEQERLTRPANRTPADTLPRLD